MAKKVRPYRNPFGKYLFPEDEVTKEEVPEEVKEKVRPYRNPFDKPKEGKRVDGLRAYLVNLYVNHVMLKSKKSALEVMANAESNSFVPNRVLRVYAERFAERCNERPLFPSTGTMTADLVLEKYMECDAHKLVQRGMWPIL